MLFQLGLLLLVPYLGILTPANADSVQWDHKANDEGHCNAHPTVISDIIPILEQFNASHPEYMYSGDPATGTTKIACYGYKVALTQSLTVGLQSTCLFANNVKGKTFTTATVLERVQILHGTYGVNECGHIALLSDQFADGELEFKYVAEKGCYTTWADFLSWGGAIWCSQFQQK